MTYWVRSAAAVGFCLAVASMPAGAQTKDASPTSSPPASPSIILKVGTVDVRDLTFPMPGGGALTIGRIGFTGLVRNDARAHAKRIDIEKIALTLASQTLEIPSIVISNADLPAPLLQIMTAGQTTKDLAGFLTATTVERIEIERIVQRDPSVQVEAIHSGFTIDGVKDGIFASVRVAGSTAAAPGAPGVTEKVQVKSGEIRYQQFNFVEMVRMLTGGGSGDAKRVLQRAVIDGFEVITDQAVVKVKRAEMNDIDGRAPTHPLPTDLKVQAGLATLPPEQQKRLITSISEMLRFVRVGRYSLEDISISIPGEGSLTIGAVTLNGFSGRGIERFAITGFDIKIPGAPVRFDRFEIEGIKYGAMLDAALDAAGSGTPPNFGPGRIAQLMPRLSAIRMSGLDAVTPQGPLALGDIKFELDERPDGANTNSSIASLKIDLVNLPANDGRDHLMALGYKQIVANAQARVSWQRQARALIVQPVGVSLDDVGKIELIARLDNVDADAAMADPDHADRVMRKARLGPIEIRISNFGFAERFYADAAKSAGVSPDAIRAGLAAEMRAQATNNLGPLLAPGSADAIATFLQSPGTITARITPTNGQPPLSLGEIETLGPAAMDRVTVTLQATPNPK
jgi:hypothetical protein